MTRDAVYEQFHEQTGLVLTLLDGRRRLRRADVLEELGRRVVGQEPALEALADVVSVAKARSQRDPNRPLATLLFMGARPGSARQSAPRPSPRTCSGRDEHLVRLDMNEFDSPAAAARLVGTFLEPEGLLTAPVRRRPFCVVLLDEIEKAHPAVFDMLLQVMGEGPPDRRRGADHRFQQRHRDNDLEPRDARRGEADWIRRPRRRSGSGRSSGAAEVVLSSGVRQPHRPDIVPFRQLGRQQMRVIADLLIEEVIGREGLVRRRCALSIDPRAMELVVDEGYHPAARRARPEA